MSNGAEISITPVNNSGLMPNNTDPANGNIKSPITGVKFNHLQTEFQTFPEEFFSGSDVTVYFGDIFVDTITGLEFTLQENLRPIYGYADYAWSDIARGTRIVQGSFRIAFKEAGHLFVILEHLAQLGADAQPALAYMMTKQKVAPWHASARQTIEDTLDYYHGDSGRKVDVYTDRAEAYVQYFDWPTMGIGADDSQAPYSQSTQAKASGFKGSVSHLQSLLIGNGYKIPSAISQGIDVTGMVGLKQRYSDGDTWPDKAAGPTSMSYHIGSSWYSTQFYGVNGSWPNAGRPSRPINSRDYYDQNEANLEKRLYFFQFLKDQNIKMSNSGSGNDVDGKFGDLVRHGVALFQGFAEYTPGTNPVWCEHEWVNAVIGGPSGMGGGHIQGWGGWVDRHTADLLSLGTTVRGYYDVATKAAVYNFQKDHQGEHVKGPDGKDYVISVTGNCDPATVWLMSKLWNTKSRTWKEKTGTKSVSRAGSDSNPDKNYMMRVKNYEREIWGRMLTKDDHSKRTFFYDGEEISTFQTLGERVMPRLKKTGFDIYITYGPIGIWALQNVDSNNPDTYQGNIPDQMNAPFPNTVHAIRNVQLASIGQVLNSDGVPIEEIYMFMARDMD